MQSKLSCFDLQLETWGTRGPGRNETRRGGMETQEAGKETEDTLSGSSFVLFSYFLCHHFASIFQLLL